VVVVFVDDEEVAVGVFALIDVAGLSSLHPPVLRNGLGRDRIKRDAFAVALIAVQHEVDFELRLRAVDDDERDAVDVAVPGSRGSVR
jgi:hypothetical protein